MAYFVKDFVFTQASKAVPTAEKLSISDPYLNSHFSFTQGSLNILQFPYSEHGLYGSC